MKFKVVKGTETFDKLTAFREHVKDVSKQAQDVVNKLGGGKYCRKSNKLAGGLSAIEFETKPEGYKVVGERWQGLYYPKVSNKADLVLINGLPTIEYNELNSIVQFTGMQFVPYGGGLACIHTVGLIFGDDVMLINVEKGCEYTPPNDVVEILASEYNKLEKKLNHKKE